MRLVTFRSSERQVPHVGAVLDGRFVLDLTAANHDDPAFSSMLALIQAGERALGRARSQVEAGSWGQKGLLDLDQLRLLAPLPDPPLMRDWSTMSKHVQNMLRLNAERKAAAAADPKASLKESELAGELKLPANWFSVPRFYTASPLNVMGHEDTLSWPDFSDQLDYELEIAMIVGKSGKNISAAKARCHIFGITLFNDFTARDVQAAEAMLAGKSKDFDGSYSIGPTIVTIDEISDLYSISVRSRINGVEQTQDNTREMILKFEDVISYASRSSTIHAGEIFASGTFERGCGAETGQLLKAGDVVELEADYIGILRNKIADNAQTNAGR